MAEIYINAEVEEISSEDLQAAEDLFKCISGRPKELKIAHDEIVIYLKDTHIKQGELILTSVGKFTRIDYHSTHLGTCYYFVSDRNEKIRIEL